MWYECVLSHFSCVQLFTTLRTIAYQAPLSMGFSRQEHWSVLSFPPPRDLPDLGIEPTSPASPALAGGFFTTSATLEVQNIWCGNLQMLLLQGLQMLRTGLERRVCTEWELKRLMGRHLEASWMLNISQESDPRRFYLSEKWITYTERGVNPSFNNSTS